MAILIVDDDPDFRMLAARALRREFPDAEMLEAGNAAALDAALRRPGTLRLLVSDLSLNWADGFEVLARVRAVHPDVPAIMFTGTGSEEAAVRAIKAGFEDYVVKSPKRLGHLAATSRAAVMRAELRRGLEANRDLLMQELYHRLHNNLQIVVGLIAFTARGLDDPVARAKLDDLGKRVQALSLLQERLYRGGDFRRIDLGAFLRSLVGDLLALDNRAIRAECDIEALPLPVDLAVPLALIANEFVTNALKHAKLKPGEVGLRLFLRCPHGRDCILEVSDTGAAAPPGAMEPEGLGLRLVQRLARQIGAAVEIEPGQGAGRTCRVRVREPARGA